MIRTNEQNSIFHKLLALRKFDKEDKAELVKVITGGRSSSSADMTVQEMALAISRLQDDQDASMKRMRAKIINIARDIFDLKKGDVWTQDHYNRLNVFLKKKFKAELSRLDHEQLRNAVTAIEAWHTSEMKKIVNNLLNSI